MNKYYCPHCGFANNPNNRFCKRCGFNLSQYKRHLQTHNQATTQQLRPTPQPNDINRFQIPTQRYNPRPYPPKRHHLVSWLSSIALIVVLAFAGIGAYSDNVWPFGSGPIGQILGQNSKKATTPNNNAKLNNSESGNSTSSKNNQHSQDNTSSNYTLIKTFWEHINNKLGSSTSNGSNTSISNLFQGSNNNNSLGGIKDWLSFVSKANDSNDTKVISIKPYDFSSSDGEIHYKVRYDFKIHAHSSNAYHHIQVYNWHATVQNGKIVSMKSPREPAKDYRE